MRDKLIDIILAAQGFKEVGTVAEGYEAVYAAEIAARKAQAGKIADALLAAGVVQEWVSVKDALPRLGEGVLVIYQPSVWDNEVMLDVDRLEEYIGGKYWRRHDYDVTHWMPLPAPPKEE